MKYKVLLFAAAIAFGTACNNQNETTATDTEDTTEATASEAGKNQYGEKITPDNALTVAQLEEKMANTDSAEVKVKAEIIESCQKKGCWVDVKLSDGTPMKVSFKDYGFFVPTENLSGKELVMEGTAKRELVPVEDLRHFAEDAGKSKEEIEKINAPEERLMFVADGVILKD